MNRATIAVPRRLEKALQEIRLYFEEAAKVSKADPFELIISFEWDAGAIWDLDDTSLNELQRLCFKAALWDLNAALSSPEHDEWKTIKDLSVERRKELEEIERRFEKYLFKAE